MANKDVKSASDTPTKVFYNKCRWCGVAVEAKSPMEICECCGSTDIVTTTYFITGEFPKTYKERKLEAIAAKERKTKIITTSLAIASGIIIASLATLLFIL